MSYPLHPDNLEITPKEEDITVHTDFVCGIMDLDIMAMFETPLLMTLV
jgi:hypothetical protein